MCTCAGQSRTSTDNGHAHVQGSPEPLQTMGMHMCRAVQKLHNGHAHVQGSPEPLQTMGMHMCKAVQNRCRQWACTCAGQPRTSKDAGYEHVQGNPEPLKTLGRNTCRAIQNLYRQWACTCARQPRTSTDNGHAHVQGSLTVSSPSSLVGSWAVGAQILTS